MRPEAGLAPEITVVVTTHNRKGWLSRCLESVWRQEGASFELVVVDDASSDGTDEWLRGLEEPRLTVLSLPKQPSVSAVRNEGLAVTRGRFVMFLDDDDWLERGALRTLAGCLRDNPEAVAAVGARRAWFMAEGYARRDSHPHRPRQRWIGDDLLLDWSAVSGQNLYPTHLVQRIGGYDPTVAGRCEDRDLWLRLAVLGPVAFRPEIVMTYRYHWGQQLPADIRLQRERVALRAIAALAPSRRGHALRLRRTTRLLDEAEDALSAGSLAKGAILVLGAFVSTPGAFTSPLIGPWAIRRLGGRLARRAGGTTNRWRRRLPDRKRAVTASRKGHR